MKVVVCETIFSIADNDTNKMMTGELFEIDNDVLRVVSLDGHIFSIRIELKDAYQPRKVIVPGKTFRKSARLLAVKRMLKLRFRLQKIILSLNLTEDWLFPD